MKASQWQILGYVRDAAVILGIAIAGMYVLSHPDQIDGFLNWVLGRR